MQATLPDRATGAHERSLDLDLLRRLLGRAVRWLVGLPARTLAADRLEIVPRLTLILVIMFPTVGGYPGLLARVLAGIGLIYGRWRREPVFWFANAAILATGIFDRWEAADNHKYLMSYWCLALGLVLTLPAQLRQRALAVTAALLCGLCMAFAVGWKLATPEYRDTGFFRWTLLSDGRFKHVAAWFGDVPLETHRQNMAQRKDLLFGYLKGRELETVPIAAADSDQLQLLAWAMTWWTVAIEGSLALAFLCPVALGGIWLQRCRDGLLLLFAVTTYMIAPVVGFGWTLIILGIAQSRDGTRTLRATYLAAFVLVYAYSLPYWSFFTW